MAVGGNKNQTLTTGRLAYGKDAAGDFYPIMVDTSGRVILERDTTGVGDNTVACGTAGTRVALSGTSTACKWVVVQAKASNTQPIVVGGSTVVAATATQRGIALEAGDAAPLLCDNLTEVYIDALVAGEAATFIYGT